MLSKLTQFFKRGTTAEPTDLTPEQDIEVAGRAFQKGDLRKAAYHVGCALATDPNNSEWLKLLDKIADTSPNPLDLAPTAERNFVGTIAVRAYLLARLKLWGEAFDLLMQIASQIPDIGYLQWAVDWLKSPEAAGNVDVAPIVGFCGRIVDRIPDLMADPAANRETIARVPTLVEAAIQTQNVPGEAFFSFIVVLNRLGMVDLMRALSEEAYKKSPNYHTASAMASAARARGDNDVAVTMYREALQYAPHDIQVRLDIGDLLLEAGRYVDAGSAYAEVLHLEHDNPWASPSFYAAQALARGDEASKSRFDVYLEDNPGNQRALDLTACFLPFFGNTLRSPREASIDAVDHIISQGLKPSRMGLSSLEAPSAILACNLEIARRIGPEYRLSFDVTPQASPDPRQPRGPQPFELWKYDGVEASPGVDPPSTDVAVVIRDIAVSPYSSNSWFRLGKELGQTLGPERIPDIAGAMVHPLPAFGNFQSWDWLLRTQYAACFTLAGVDSGWDGSLRREALIAIVNGPADWTCGAAAVVLAMIVRECPEAEAEVSKLLWDLAGYLLRLQGSLTNIVEPVLLALLRMPNLPQVRRLDAEKTLEHLRASL